MHTMGFYHQGACAYDKQIRGTCCTANQLRDAQHQPSVSLARTTCWKLLCLKVWHSMAEVSSVHVSTWHAWRGSQQIDAVGLS